MSRTTNPEQLGRLEAPPVRKVEGALSVALVFVPFRGVPVELDILALIVLSIEVTEVDITVSAGGVPKEVDGKGFVRADIGMSEYVAVITGMLLPAPPSPPLASNPQQINATA